MVAPNLKTKRLLLRHWKKDDLLVFAKMSSNPKVMKFLRATFPFIFSREESDDLAERFQKELNEKNYGTWAVELPNIAPFIGCIGLHYHDFQADFTPCITIGWRLDINYWGKGYATEGAQKALEYGFLVLNLNEIVAFTPHLNEKSKRIMEKLKMKTDPKENFIYPKIPKDHPLQPFVLYRIKKREYNIKNELENITFRKAIKSDEELLKKWFNKPHVQEFWDNSPEMWQNVKGYIIGRKILYDYWIGFLEKDPFCLIITSDASENDPNAPGSDNHLLPYIEPQGKTLTIDFMIAEEDFLGRGLSYITLNEFTNTQEEVSAFLIDPESSNTKAIHVYEKAGFEKIGSYTPKRGYFSGLEHFIMKKKMIKINK